MNSGNASGETSSSSRFSLILLEPGEIYFEDYLVYYHELQCPFNDEPVTPKLPNTPTTLGGAKSPQAFQFSQFPKSPLEQGSVKQMKGNLKICSKSVVFDPINLSSPLLKFPFKAIELIEQYDTGSAVEDTSNTDDFEDIYSLKFNSTEQMKRDQNLQQLKTKCFSLKVKQVIKCKPNNKISPYTTQKRQNANERHYFQFIFTSVHDSLDLMRQLERASTLDYEHENLMQQLILKSRLARQGKFDLKLLDDMFKEQIQFECEVNKISPLVANPGKIILSNMCLYYKPFNNLDNERQVLKTRLEHVKYVIKRRYHLKKVGCEIVFDENADDLDTQRRLPYLYLTFEDEKTRDEFYNRLVVDNRDKLVKLNNFSQENMLQKWRYGTISNFDYLMYLNQQADRSYNDLTQYPIFPWVLSDYTSDTIDLTNPRIYRDLSKPIGALNDERIIRLRRRCREMQESTTGFNNQPNTQDNQTFLYGTHYSTPAFVSFFLVRQMPEWQLCLQNGRFDHPNRLFHNIADTWKNCLSSDSDVKELIPEFYDTTNIDHMALPHSTEDEKLGGFLRNKLELDLGTRQDGIRVNDVQLPRWARNSPAKFIRTMREALESPCVSENLHKWIDLIFGYKQRGEEALKADNLFYYLCYEGAVDLESIKNYSQRKSLEVQIQEFGQIPTQLFTQPHLPKVKKDAKLEFDKLELSTGDGDSDSPGLNNYANGQSTLGSNHETATTAEDNDSLSQYTINANSFKELEVKLSVKLHKDQINECRFIDTPTSEKTKQTKLKRKQTLLTLNNNDKHDCGDKDEHLKVIQLPLVASVSNDNWLKILSLEEKALFRSKNVSDFNLSSVDATSDSYERTLLFLSCWDNGLYIYDMNYNRCIFSLPNAHDDAVSRVRVINAVNEVSEDGDKCKYNIVLTSSWDSLIKVWIVPLKTEAVKTKFVSELAFESSVLDFQLGQAHLAAMCDDGNVYLWKLDVNKIITKYENSNQFAPDESSNSDSDDYDFADHRVERDYYPRDDSCFSFLHSIPCSDQFGKINDCRIVESSTVRDPAYNSEATNQLCTIAVCTNLGYVKIYNVETNYEIFSIRLNCPDSPATPAKLTKLVYSPDFIIACGSRGFLYFIDLQQQASNGTGGETGSFLSHTMQLGKCQLSSLSLYKKVIVCVGDSEGTVYFLSLLDI